MKRILLINSIFLGATFVLAQNIEVKKYEVLEKEQGKEVIPCTYDLVEDFHEGLAAVVKDEKCGYIDKQGNSTFDYYK